LEKNLLSSSCVCLQSACIKVNPFRWILYFGTLYTKCFRGAANLLTCSILL
jgi:hypothetical protein